MSKHFFRAMAVIAVTGCISIGAMAQQETEKARISDNEEIVIKRKGDKNTKVTVEINDGDVKVNGKPLSEFQDENVSISKRKANTTRIYAPARSPFRGGTSVDDPFFEMNLNGVSSGNKAMLGVMTEKNEEGVKINSVTKGSAAEKAGLKQNDIITKVDETSVTSPETLTKAIGKYKPEDKAIITYKRDKKEQKATATLGKRQENIAMFNGDNDMFKTFDFEGIRPKLEGYGLARSGSPKLGIKAQDTEDGKGVKVLDVDDESTAEKAGIKEGDIIIEFDGKSVNSAGELAEAAREAKQKSAMKVKVNRNGKSQEMEIKVPKQLKTANL